MAKAAKPKAKKPDLDKLDRLAKEIAGYTSDKTDLIERLKTTSGLKITRNKKTGIVTATMAGIKAQSTAGAAYALTNWGNAARRLVQAG